MKLKIFLFFSLLIFTGNTAFSQNDWGLDYEKSMTKAKIENKAVLLLFTGSDWCPPCKLLHSKIFETKVFEEYAKENLILIKADFPKRKNNLLPIEQKIHNENLSKRFNIRGFPTVLILDTNGKVLDKSVGYPRLSPKDYINKINNNTNSVRLAKK